MPVSETKAKQFILDFREELYGIRKDGTQDPVFSGISRNLKNAIERLSQGLYSEDVHFILELVLTMASQPQAADD